MSSEIVIEKRGRGRPKKEKVEQQKPTLTEEQREKYKKSKNDYASRRSKMGEHLMLMLKKGLICGVNPQAQTELLEWIQKLQLKRISISLCEK